MKIITGGSCLLKGVSPERVCAAMVTYHPDAQVTNRIELWLREAPVLCVIDNGSPPDSLREIRYLASRRRIVLIENRKNIGIAAALNQAVDFARSRGCDWLLTLDQDSMPIEGYVKQQCAALSACPFAQEVAIVGGRAIENHLDGGEEDTVSSVAYRQWRTGKIVITSGSLCRCDTLMKLGGFRTDLFIDLVDTEYCLRLSRNGLRVIICERASFYHQFGQTLVHRIGPFRIVKRLYTPTRNYYRFRNGIILILEWWRQEPEWALRRLVRLARLLMNVILLHDRKAENLSMASRGIIDGLRCRSGELEPQGKKNC